MDSLDVNPHIIPFRYNPLSALFLTTIEDFEDAWLEWLGPALAEIVPVGSIM